MSGAEKFERMEQFHEELQLQSVSPAGNDRRIGAYCRASMAALDRLPQYRSIVEEVLLEREDFSPTYSVNLALRALQKQLIYRTAKDYPHIYDEPEPWVDTLEYASEPDSAIHGEFVEDLQNRNLQSNVSERYKAIKLAAILMEPRVGRRPSVLDVGCSRNHGLKKLTTGKKFPFRNIGAEELKWYPSRHSPEGGVIPIPDRKSARAVGTILDQSIRLNKSVGLDIESIDDESNRVWARSCSFYPSELLNERRVKEYDLLDTLERKNILFQQADFTEVDPDEFREETGVKQFDIITFSTVMYQLNEAQREAMLHNAKELLKPDGIVLVQDFAEVDQEDPTRLEFSEHWFDSVYPYRTLMLDPKITDQFVELFRWDNGRCNKILNREGAGRLVQDDFYHIARYAELSAANATKRHRFLELIKDLMPAHS